VKAWPMPSVFETKILSAFETGRAEENVRSSPDLLTFVWLAPTHRRRDGGGARYFRSDVITFEFRGSIQLQRDCFDRCGLKLLWDVCAESV